METQRPPRGVDLLARHTVMVSTTRTPQHVDMTRVDTRYYDPLTQWIVEAGDKD